MNHAVAIVQARAGSSRLPGKVLATVAGRPLLAHVLDRARLIPGIDGVLLATTMGDEDVAVAELGARCGADVFRGGEDDGLDRYYHSAKLGGADPVMRLTGDCPLPHPQASGT